MTNQESAYFNAKADGAGVSGDDVNRRLRERRLGFAEPSSDWDQAGVIVHCIYPGQMPTKSHACIVLWDLSTCGPMGFVAESLEDILGKIEVDEPIVTACQSDPEESPCPDCKKICPGCSGPFDDGECEHCDQDPCLNCLHNGREKEPGTFGQDKVEKTCEACVHEDVSTGSEPCLNCLGDDWEAKADDTMPPAIESDIDAASMDRIKDAVTNMKAQKDGLRHAWHGCYQDCCYRNGNDMCFQSNSFCDFDGCRRVGN